MYLKRLELQGFKSFADRTVFEFSPGVSAIVGPNGSGKSNVVDAVRWVLGEQSAKTLRGGKMEDVIFSGSHGRKPVGMAKVTLVLDNSDGGLPLDYQEVAVSRTLYRSGESRYEINRQETRLRDVHELFMDTGLGKDGFSIIGQGKIDDILSLQADERRGLIEEAAGISKYKYRKREAERRLQSTEGDIDRLEDIFYELDSRLPGLADQAEAVQTYQTLDEKEKALHLAQLVNQYQLAEKDREPALAALAEAEDAYVTRVKDMRQVATEEVEVRTQRLVLADRVEADNERHLALVQGYNEAERQRALAEERLKQLAYLTQEDEASLAQERDRLQAAEDRLAALSEKKAALLATCNQLKAALADFDRALSDRRRRQQEDNQALEALSQAQFNLLRDQAEARNSLARLEEQARAEGIQQNRYEGALAALSDKKEDLEARLAEAQYRAGQEEGALQAAQEEAQRLDEGQRRLARQEEVAAASLAQLSRETIQAQSRLKALADMEAAGSGYYGGVQAVLKNKGQFPGLIGTVAQRVSFDPQYAHALESALGGAAQHIIASDDQAAQGAIQWLKTHKSGRATFLPRNTVHGPAPGQAIDDEAFIGYAVDLVTYAPEDEGIMRQLLSRIAIVKSLPDAVRLAKAGGFRQRLVTLDGDLVSPGGSLSGGRGKGQSVLSRTAERLALKDRLQALADDEKAAQAKLDRCRTAGAQAKEAFQAVQAQLTDLRQSHALHKQTLAGLAKEAEALDREERVLALDREGLATARQDREKAHIEAQAALERALDQYATNEAQEATLKEKLAAGHGEDDDLTGKRQHSQVALAQAQESLRHQVDLLAEAQDRQTSLQAGIDRLEYRCRGRAEERKTLETSLAKNQAEVKGGQEALESLQKDLLADREALQTLQTREAALTEALAQATKDRDQAKADYDKALAKMTGIQDKRDRAAADLTASFDWAMDEAIQAADLSLLDQYSSKDLARWRREKAAMGPLNFNAPEEYQALQERSQFLRRQLDDLEGAKKRLIKVISEMEEVMADRFAQTFHALNNRFNRIFQQIFLGGQARLSLSMPENMLETGVDIMAQPPGKRERTLTLLSGGERAMTAIALLFALLEVRPSPFVILDEIEAALDAANVERFARFIEAYAEGTQFVIISHRQGTMEAAESLYGVTMDKDGISRLVSVQIDDYLEKET